MATPDLSYFVRVDLYPDGVAGAVLDMDLDAEMMRNISDQLFTLARHIRDMAWKESGDDADHQLAVTRIYADSRVNTWTSNSVSSAEQIDWLKRRFEDAAESVRPW